MVALLKIVSLVHAKDKLIELVFVQPGKLLLLLVAVSRRFSFRVVGSVVFVGVASKLAVKFNGLGAIAIAFAFQCCQVFQAGFGHKSTCGILVSEDVQLLQALGHVEHRPVPPIDVRQQPVVQILPCDVDRPLFLLFEPVAHLGAPADFMYVDIAIVELILFIVVDAGVGSVTAADHTPLLLSTIIFHRRILALLIFVWIFWFIAEVVENVRDVMIKELAERHHGDTLQIATEAPTDEMDIQPLVVLASHQLLWQ